MKWCFLVRGRLQERIQARILQTVERLLLPLVSFSSSMLNHQLIITFAVEANPDEARRVQAMLWRIHGIEAVEAFSEDSSICLATALFQIRYNTAQKEDVFNCLHQYGAKILLDQTQRLCIEIIGSSVEIERMHSCLLSYVAVDLVSYTLGYINASLNSPLQDNVLTLET